MISKTHQVHPLNKIRSRNTFNKITSTNIRLLMRNEVNNWQQVCFFIQTSKKKTQYRRVVNFTRLTKGQHKYKPILRKAFINSPLLFQFKILKMKSIRVEWFYLFSKLLCSELYLCQILTTLNFQIGNNSVFGKTFQPLSLKNQKA